MAEKAREGGVDLKASSVTKLICIGEPIRDAAFNLNASGATLEAAWGAKVYSTYGVTELANSLCECEAGQGGHLRTSCTSKSSTMLASPWRTGKWGKSLATTFGVRANAGHPLSHGRLCGNVSCAVRVWSHARLGPIIGHQESS